nr:hypothetical protein Cplu_204 [Cedratvirus plubellavi]
MDLLVYVNRGRFIRRVNIISEEGFGDWYYLLQERRANSVLVDLSGTIHVVNNRKEVCESRKPYGQEEIALANLSDETYFVIEVVDVDRLQGKQISSFLPRRMFEDEEERKCSYYR